MNIPAPLLRLLARNRVARRLHGPGVMARCARLLGAPLVRVKVRDATMTFDLRDRDQVGMMADAYEPEMVELIEGALRPGDCYVDVGAHIGYTAVVAASRIGPTGRMILFEVNPAALQRLKAHLDSIPADRRPEITLIEQAASHQRGELTFLPAEVLGHSRVATDADGAATAQRADGAPAPITVPTCVMGSTLRELGVQNIRLLKIDIEGHEPWALLGLGDFLANRQVDFAVSETNGVLLCHGGVAPEFLWSVFARHGYAGIRQEDGAPLTRGRLEEDESRLGNYVFASDWEGLRELGLWELPAEACPTGYAPEEIEALAAGILDPSMPIRREREAVRMVRAGKLAEGIALAEELQRRGVATASMLGHLGHWHEVAGQPARAIEAYAALLELRPTDEGAARRLASLRGAAEEGAREGSR